MQLGSQREWHFLCPPCSLTQGRQDEHADHDNRDARPPPHQRSAGPGALHKCHAAGHAREHSAHVHTWVGWDLGVVGCGQQHAPQEAHAELLPTFANEVPRMKELTNSSDAWMLLSAPMVKPRGAVWTGWGVGGAA